MPPKKKEKVLPPVRVTDEMYEATKQCADDAGEYVSDYIRKAVEARNAQYKPFHYKADSPYPSYGNTVTAAEKLARQPDSNRVTTGLSKEPIEQMIEKVKQHQKGGKMDVKPDATDKPKMVQSFMKKGCRNEQ